MKNIEIKAINQNWPELKGTYKYFTLYLNLEKIKNVKKVLNIIQNCSRLKFEKLEIPDNGLIDFENIGPYIMFMISHNDTSYYVNTTAKYPSARVNLDESCLTSIICTLGYTLFGLGFNTNDKCVDILNRKFSQLPTYYRYFAMTNNTEGIKEALDVLQKRTCLKFEKVSFNFINRQVYPSDFEPYIIYDKTEEPNSYNENNTIKNNISQVHLAANCVDKTTCILKYTLFALGAVPTHRREDRDNYIKVLYQNVKNDTRNNRNHYQKNPNQKLYDRFSIYIQKEEQYSFEDTSYEYGSLTHPNKTYYSLNGEPTLEANISEYGHMMGQEYNITFNDVKLINYLYCYNNCSLRGKQSCENGGYPNPNNCKECLCPDGFEGKHCEKLINNEIHKCVNTTLIAGKNLSYIMLHSDAKCKYNITSRNDQKIEIYLANCTVASKDLCFNDNGIEVKHLKDPGTKGLCLTRELSKPISLTSESNKAFVFYSGRNKETDGCFVLYREKQEKVLNESEIIKKVNKIIEDPTSMPGFMIGFDV
uniref:Metalloendopeptidase n=2 Tax=Parastrongyloides trichosuri TaxID=131310 RepID=A0A0N4ZZL0_PARTI